MRVHDSLINSRVGASLCVAIVLVGAILFLVFASRFGGLFWHWL